ncbi:related to PHO87 protein [Ramularia collo-cygni]|uniref:Related to PHO87 protein n=1 Tax=Ramularia collo-cygni TaxID=112498 RepID=A0A2D3V2C2_9PEZI|nr:related to PHO87 protein [Ramularia collo-cygni]CZT24427.1 related to PHO87 protein [Ramularia collo-cygni]
MLSAFKAQSIHELKARDKSRIESLLAYGDRLLVGLSNGYLRVHRVNSEEPAGSAPAGSDDSADKDKDTVGKLDTVSSGDGTTETKTKPVELMREVENFSRRPVQQLAIIKEANLLVSLSDTYVSLHDLKTFRLVERLESTKGAVCFAVTSNVVKDSDTNVPSLVSRLAVGAKRKVLCWTWQDMEMLPEVAELSMEASVKSLNWADGTRLFAGMDPGFSVVDITTREITAITKASPNPAGDVNSGELAGVRFAAVSSSGMGYMGMGSWVPKPMATGLFGNQVLLAKDVNTLFTGVDGKPLEKRQVPWSLAPEAIGYSYPYLLALQPPEKGSLQIRNPDTLTLLQSIGVPGATILHVPQPNISLAHAGKGFLVASDRVIWRMNALPYDVQLAELAEKQRFDEATSLLELLEDTLIDDKAGRIREIMSQKAISLFHQQKYRLALDLFTDAETSPERVIALYPRSVAGELSTIVDEPEAEPAAAEANDGKDEDVSKDTHSTPSKGMFGILKGGHKKADSDTASMKSPGRLDTDNMSIRAKTTKSADKPLEGEDLKMACRCLSSFLAQARKELQRHLNPDGTMKEDPPSMDSETGKPAFSNLLPNSVVDAKAGEIDWRSELINTAQLVDTTLFRAYMLATPFLAGSLFRIDNFCDPEVVQSALYEGERYNDLIDFLHGKGLHRQALEMLAKFGKGEADGQIPDGMTGPERTVGYLKQLPPELVDVVLEYVRWPIDENPIVGMDVFLADTDNAERLPRDQVLEFLASIDSKLEIQYLEHIINELGEGDATFHQHLVDLYLLELKKKDLEDSRRTEIKGKLEAFMLKSKAYNRAKTLPQLPASDPTFYEARAIVYSALGQHKQALSIYVFQIQDYEKAENYCNKGYIEQQAERQACLLDGTTTHEKPHRAFEPEDSSTKPNIFAILLGLYLRPPPGEEKRWPQALELLSKHGARLPASSTLDLMPDDLAVKELQDYFRGRIRNATSILREEQIVRSLEGVRRTNTERLLSLGPDGAPGGKALGKNRRVRIGEDDHCKVCHKRFGASAVRVYPDNQVIHYGCIGRSTAPGATRRSAAWG